MKKIQIISIVVSAIVLVSCQSETLDKTEAKSSEEGLESKNVSKEKGEISDQNTSAKPDQPVPFQEKDQAEDASKMPTKGSVIVSGYADHGGDYLKSIAKGQQEPIRNLSLEDLESLGLDQIKSKAKPVETYQKSEKTTDADHAYARVLNLHIGLPHFIRCQGIFEDSDSFIVPYFNHKIESYIYIYVVKKSDGHISRYYVPNAR